MLAKLFAPALPAEELAKERAKVAKRLPHLALVGKDRRPDPTMFAWFSVEEMIERERGR
jgi:hypothetical protein